MFHCNSWTVYRALTQILGKTSVNLQVDEKTKYKTTRCRLTIAVMFSDYPLSVLKKRKTEHIFLCDLIGYINICLERHYGPENCIFLICLLYIIAYYTLFLKCVTFLQFKYYLEGWRSGLKSQIK